MRILIAYWDLTVGGVQHMTTKLANGLAGRGHAVTIALAFRAPSEEPYPLDPRVRVVAFGTRRTRIYAARLVRLLRRERGFDAIFSATTVPNLVSVAARALARSPARLVISERDNPDSGFSALTSRRARLLWRLKPWLYGRADAIVAVSTPLADALARHTGLARARITVIHNPAAPDSDFAGAPPPHAWLSDGAMPVIVAAGRFHPQKDFPTLVRAFGILRARRPARLVILGEGAERGRIEAAVAAAGLQADVLLPGMQPDIMPWLVHANLFAMSSVFEGFGNVLVQALAAGCRIVSTDAPDGPAEILENGRHGALTPVGDAAALAAAMERVLAAPHDADAQRRRAAAFSTEAIVARYERLFAGDADA